MSSTYRSKSKSTENITTTEYDYNIDAFLNALNIDGRPITISVNITYEGDKIQSVKVITKE